MRVAVVGLGGMGSAAAAHLAMRGAEVVGFDRFGPPHDRGSSHGGSRVARQAYFEHPDYVPLLKRALVQWDQLGGDCFHRVGVLIAGPADSEVIAASRASAEAHDIAVHALNPAAMRAAYPMLQLDEMHGLLEPGGGFVVPEASVRNHLSLARQHGATLHFHTPVTAVEALQVRTEDGTYRVDRVVVTAGAWARGLLPSLEKAGLQPQRKHIVWSRPRRPMTGLPVWLVDDPAHPAGAFYGVPPWTGQPEPEGMKSGFHGFGPVADPNDSNRDPDPDRVARFQQTLERYFPGVFAPPHAATTCLYTMSPDGHFVLDRLPSGICVGVGLSGHGFKFAPVVGEILADFALEGGTDHRVDFLSAARFAT